MNAKINPPMISVKNTAMKGDRAAKNLLGFGRLNSAIGKFILKPP